MHSLGSISSAVALAAVLYSATTAAMIASGSTARKALPNIG